MRTKTVTRTLIGAAALSTVVGAPALAARPSEPSGPSGTIQLIEPVGVAAFAAIDSTDSLPAPTGLTYDGEARFEATVDGKVSAKADVYVTLLCWQDGNVVYQWSAAPDFAFPLHDQDGQGLEWEPTGDAVCEAWLVYRVDKGKSSEISLLASTGAFAVSAEASA